MKFFNKFSRKKLTLSSFALRLPKSLKYVIIAKITFMVFTYIFSHFIKHWRERKTMLNFSWTPNRLDASRPLQKTIFIFCMFVVVLMALYALLTIGTQKANQSCEVSNFDAASTLSQEGEKIWPSSKNCHIKIVENALDSFQIDEISSAVKKKLDRMALPIPMELYLHPENTLSSKFHWVPVVLDEKMSEDDILVDLSSVINPELAYEISDYYEYIVGLIVERESGNQPFIGQLLVAEDVVSRIRSGIYGPNIDEILMLYLAEKENGRLRVYNGSKEILEARPSVQEAVKLALSGSQVSYYLLQAVTELRNEQYGLDLDDTYYKWGALFHFAPNRILDNPKAISSRRFSRVPVSFQYYEHIFYGRWLPSSGQLIV